MSDATIRLKWARKILTAKHFVVLTDKESIIAFSGLDISNLRDEMMLREQAASIRNYINMLEELENAHIEEIHRYIGDTPKTLPARRKKSAPATKKKG